MGKRANNEGSCSKRADGRWEGAVSIGAGKRVRVYGKTRDEVNQKVVAILGNLHEGRPILDGRQTVGTYLTSWIESVKPSVRPRTWEKYEQVVRLHLIPTLGKVRLVKLSPQHLSTLYARKATEGQSARSIGHIHRVAHRALDQAARWDLVPRNVASLTRPPRVPRREMMTLTSDQARALLAASSGSRLHALWVVALSGGLRQGELLGLRWRNVDLDEATLSITAALQATRGGPVLVEPKSNRSRRQITLTQTAVDALRRHRVAQNAERLQMGAAWTDLDLVFCNRIGRPLSAQNVVTREFRPLLTKAMLPTIRMHDLRHSCASLMLEAGVPVKVISEQLGHASTAFTMDTYAHVLPGMGKQAAAAMDAVLG